MGGVKRRCLYLTLPTYLLFPFPEGWRIHARQPPPGGIPNDSPHAVLLSGLSESFGKWRSIISRVISFDFYRSITLAFMTYLDHSQCAVPTAITASRRKYTFLNQRRGDHVLKKVPEGLVHNYALSLAQRIKIRLNPMLRPITRNYVNFLLIPLTSFISSLFYQWF